MEAAVQPAPAHTTVLLHEAIDALLGEGAGPLACYVDATYGRGGHSTLLLQRLPADATLIAFDRDPEAVAHAQSVQDSRFSIRQQPFSDIGALPASSLDGVLMDLGVSSPQIDSAQRGFSFRFDGPLDMRMDTTRGQSVAQWLQEADVQTLTEVIRDYGEERFAGAIAKAIVARRTEHGPITRTTELATLVAAAVKTREKGQNPATRTFQALRIFINAELDELTQGLSAALRLLKPGGRLVVISFHSLEDRIVKQFIAEHAREVYDRRTPFAAPKTMALKALGRIKPCASEIAANPRARSAVMRVAQRLPRSAEAVAA
ncbi:MAG: 16S rRNA (cytosine(1402)-N(4))-methyltransferase RsmH [Betaproteobacteria bacterium]|jgi:16S rRNA (cytosine1402-N4)-methyltransferase|nr:16S rRNA (cytosine(1402)-N(4))-methyltransferase RsmH [Betaproteobacteria bacterium]